MLFWKPSPFYNIEGFSGDFSLHAFTEGKVNGRKNCEAVKLQGYNNMAKAKNTEFPVLAGVCW